MVKAFAAGRGRPSPQKAINACLSPLENHVKVSQIASVAAIASTKPPVQCPGYNSRATVSRGIHIRKTWEDKQRRACPAGRHLLPAEKTRTLLGQWPLTSRRLAPCMKVAQPQ